MDPVPWLKGDPVQTNTARRLEMKPGKLLLHISRASPQVRLPPLCSVRIDLAARQWDGGR
jgi:hypothetical protein